MKLSDLKVGDKIKGFKDFDCIPDKAVRTVRMRNGELGVVCKEGWHLLDGQEDENGELVGLSLA